MKKKGTNRPTNYVRKESKGANKSLDQFKRQS